MSCSSGNTMPYTTSTPHPNPTFLLLSASILLLTSTLTSATCPPGPIRLSLSNFSLPTQPPVNSWGALISLSGPSPSDPQQQLIGVPSTVTNTTFLTTSPLCSDPELSSQNITYAQCISRRGGVIPLTNGKPDAVTLADTSGLERLNPGWVTIMGGPSSAFPAAVSGVVHLHGREEVDMIAGLIEGGNNHTASHIGLGNASVLLESLVASGRIAAHSFGLDAGSQSHAAPRSGGLVLGGYDDGAREGGEWRFALSEYEGRNGNRVCPLQVTIRSMALRGGDGGDVILVEPSDTLQACLEPYDNLFRVPGTMMAELKRSFAGMTGYEGEAIRYTTATSSSGPRELRELQEIYVPEPGLIYPYIAKSTGMFDGSLVITLDNGFSVEIPTEELYNPVRGIAKDGSRVVNQNFTELGVYQDEAPEDAAVLGKVFLSRVYLYVDYDADEFTLSLAATEGRAGSILVATGEGTCGDDDENGWSSVMKGFVALVVILGVALVTVLALWLLRRRKDRAGGKGARRRMPWQTRRDREAGENGDVLRSAVNDHEYDDGLGAGRRSSAYPPPMARTEQPMVETMPDPPAPQALASMRQSSLDSGVTDPHHPVRLNSVEEVQGTSALDPPFSPDGRVGELGGHQLGGHQLRAELDSPRADRMDSNASSSLEPTHSFPSSSGGDGRPVVGSNPASNFARGNPLDPRGEMTKSRSQQKFERKGG